MNLFTAGILKYLILAAAWFLNLFFYIIPDFSFLSNYQDEITEAFSWYKGLIEWMNPIIPSTTVNIIMIVFISFYSLKITLKFISWVLRKIPILGMS